MSANIEIRKINGVEVASYAENAREEIAWHGLGQRFYEPMTAKQAIEQCHADFKVGLQPIISASPTLMNMIEEGQQIDASMLKSLIIEGKKATMRLDHDETLGVVSDSYGIVQNEDAFNFIDMLTTGELGGDTPTIECAGVLGQGERIFVTAKFPEPIRLGAKDDVVDMYVVFTTSHDGSGAVQCMVTPVRVVCNNTLNLAMRQNSGKLSLRHTRFVTNRLDLTAKENATMAYGALNLYNTYKVYFEDKLTELAKKKVSDAQVKDILAKVLLPKEGYDLFKSTGNIFHDDISTRSKNLYYNMMNSIESGVGQDIGEKGTALWVLNGITSHYQNHTDWGNRRVLKKYDSIMEGNVQKKVQEAFELLEVA